MKYAIYINEYKLNEDGIVISRDGGSLTFNDADDFIMIWNYLRGCGPDKDISDHGITLMMQPKWIEPYVCDYQITGDAYKLWKEREAEEQKRCTKNNNEELPF